MRNRSEVVAAEDRLRNDGLMTCHICLQRFPPVEEHWTKTKTSFSTGRNFTRPCRRCRLDNQEAYKRKMRESQKQQVLAKLSSSRCHVCEGMSWRRHRNGCTGPCKLPFAPEPPVTAESYVEYVGGGGELI